MKDNSLNKFTQERKLALKDCEFLNKEINGDCREGFYPKEYIMEIEHLLKFIERGLTDREKEFRQLNEPLILNDIFYNFCQVTAEEQILTVNEHKSFKEKHAGLFLLIISFVYFIGLKLWESQSLIPFYGFISLYGLLFFVSFYYFLHLSSKTSIRYMNVEEVYDYFNNSNNSILNYDVFKNLNIDGVTLQDGYKIYLDGVDITDELMKEKTLNCQLKCIENLRLNI